VTVTGDGTALGLGRWLAPKETGRWWVRGDRLCQQWPTWYDGKPSCFQIRMTGERTQMGASGRPQWKGAHRGLSSARSGGEAVAGPSHSQIIHHDAGFHGFRPVDQRNFAILRGELRLR
jgi:hypothetical protein